MRVCGLPQEGIPRRNDGTYAHGMSEEMTYAHLGRSGPIGWYAFVAKTMSSHALLPNDQGIRRPSQSRGQVQP